MNVFISFLLIGVIRAQRGSPTVRTPQGDLLGREQIISNKLIYSFRGIKYAESPTGQRRFRPVAPFTDTWSGIKSAQEEGAPCPQPFTRGRIPYDEDCLHLSVWTDSLPTQSGREPLKPVLFYLTGSLFTTDYNQLISPEDLVSEQRLVVITVSYRLNVFGFLSLENPVFPGNMGLLDQYFALYWAYKNIQYFGGDPSQISLAGSGAGAASALFHALSPRAAPLIKRVLAVSGAPTAPWAMSRNPQENGLRFIQRLDCVQYSSAEVLNCLQRKSVEEIITSLEQHLSSGNISNIFSPIDDSFLGVQDQYLGGGAQDLINRASFRIPVVLGINSQEGKDVLEFLRYNIERSSSRDLIYLIENTLIPSILSPYPGLVNNQMIQEMIFQMFFKTRNTFNDQDKGILLAELAALYTEVFYTAPVLQTAQLMYQRNLPIYMFVNKFPVQNIQNNLLNSSADSSSFLALLFGTTQFERLTGAIILRTEREVAQRLQTAILPLLTFGQPSPSLRWINYEPNDGAYLDLETLKVEQNYKAREASFWNDLIPRMSITASASSSQPTCDVKSDGQVDVYSTLTWLLLTVVLLLLVLLAVLWVNGRRRTRTSSVFTLGSGLGGIGGSCLERNPPRAGSGPRGRWRETLTSNKL